MSAITITIAQQKGGAGKTTLAAHFLAAAREKQWQASGIDIDPQGSLSQWYEERRRVKDDPLLRFVSVPGWRVRSEIDLMKRASDVIIIDSPPHADIEAKIAIRSADLVVIPVQPSPMDVWATKAILKLAREEKKEILLVLNRVPPRANLTAGMLEKLRELEVQIADNDIGNRTLFASAMTEGLTAMETETSSIAANEMRRLFDEIMERIGRYRRT